MTWFSAYQSRPLWESNNPITGARATSGHCKTRIFTLQFATVAKL